MLRYLALSLLLIGLLLAAQRAVTSPTLAARYADFALQHLPQYFSAFAATDSPTGAYNFCIRQVVRRLTPASSVETFPSSTSANTVSLGDGRYRVESYFHEDRSTGERLEHHYTCSVRYAEGRWILEDLSPIRHARVD